MWLAPGIALLLLDAVTESSGILSMIDALPSQNVFSKPKVSR